MDAPFGLMLAGLLQRIENRAPAASRAWASHQEYLIVEDAHARALRHQSQILQKVPQDQDAIESANQEVIRASSDQDTAWKKFKADRSFIDAFCSDLGLMLSRLPVSIGLPVGFKGLIESLDIQRLDAWIDPPAIPDLETLTIRLTELRELIETGEKSKDLTSSRVCTLNLPTGTTWREIEIRFLSEFQFQVFAQGKPQAAVGFEEAGFADGRAYPNRKPTRAWTVLLALANSEGCLSKHHRSIAQPANFEKRIQEIRTRLRALCGLADDPFHRSEHGEYRLIPRVSPPPR